MCKCITILSTLFLWLLSQPLAADVHQATSYGPAEGLHERFCTSLATDLDGFLWVGSRGGLFRYDGRKFKRIGAEGDSRGCLRHQSVRALAYHEQYGLLIGGVRGLDLLDKHRHKVVPIDLNMSSSDVRSVVVLQDGKVVLSADNGLFVLRIRSEGTKPRASVIASCELKGVLSMIVIGDTRLLAVQGIRAVELDIVTDSTGRCEVRRHSAVFHSPRTIAERLRNGSPQFAHMPAFRGRMISENGELHVFCTGLPPERIDVEPKFIDQALQAEIEVPDVLVMQDGTIWLTSMMGLLRLQKVPIRPYRVAQSSALTRQVEVRCAIPMKDKMIAATTSGIIYELDELSQPRSSLDLGHPVNTMVPIGDNSILAATTGQGIVECDLQTKRWRKLPRQSVGSSYHIVHTSQGYIGAVNMIGRSSSMLYVIRGAPGRDLRIADSVFVPTYVWTIIERPDGALLLGCKDGVFIVHENGIVAPLSSVSHDGPRDVWALHIDHNRELWIGSWESGLWQMNITKSRPRRVSWKELRYEPITGISTDRKQRLWVTTYSQIWCLPSEDQVPFTVTKSDGLHEAEIWANGLFLHAGLFHIAGGGGFSVFDPLDLPRPRAKTKVLIEDVMVDALQKHDVYASEAPLYLPADSRQLSFRVITPVIMSSPLPTIEYQFAAHDVGWQAIDDDGLVMFPMLEAGEHTIHIRVRGLDGVVTSIRTFRFVVALPFYRQWWFIIVAILVAVSTTIIVVRGRLQTQARAHEHHLTIAELELQSLRLQMKPHFIYNALNAVQAAVLVNDKARALPLLGALARLIRLSFELSRHSLIGLDREVQLVRLYLDIEQERFGHRFQVLWEISTELDLESILVPPILIQPFVENAVVHGLAPRETGGILTINMVQVDEGSTVCSIEDNGVGRDNVSIRDTETDSRQGHISLGQKVNEERIRRLNEIHGERFRVDIVDLYDPNGKPAGTKVVITIRTDDI